MCGSYFTGRDRLRDHILRQHSHILTQNNLDLQTHLDQSRNFEKHFQEKYRPKSSLAGQTTNESPSEMGPIPMTVPASQPVYLQIGGLQFQALQVVPLSGEASQSIVFHL